jgi:tetratricopeptide (TPR) repeat protein
MRLQRLLLILLAVYVVFVGGSPYSYTIFPVRALHHIVMTVALAWWLIRHLRDGLPITPLNLALYAAVVVWVISALLSADPRMAFENLWFPLVHLLIFFVLADLLMRGRQRLVMETHFMLAALAVFMALLQFASWLFGLGIVPGTEIGWLQVLGPDVPLPLTTPMLYLPLGVSTWLAAYAAPNILLAFGWSLTARQRDFRIALRLLALGLLVALILTFSRGGFISLAAGVGLFIILRASQSEFVRGLNLQRAASALTPIMVLLGVVAVIVFTIGQSEGRYSGDALRLNLWRSAVAIARDHPVIGVGAGLFGRAVREYRDPTVVDDRLGTAHSVLLNTAAEEGLAGLAVLGALAALTFRAWWRQWRNTENPSPYLSEKVGATHKQAAGLPSPLQGTPSAQMLRVPQRKIPLLQSLFDASDGRKIRLEVSFAALVGIGAQSLFDNFNTTPLVALIALLAVYCTVQPGSVLDKPRGHRWAAGIALALTLAYGVFWIQSDRAQAAFIRSVRTNDINAAGEAASIDPALHLYPLHIAYLTGQQTPLDSDPAAAIAEYQRALELEPTWDTGWINLAALQARAGDIESALESLERAERISVRNAATINRARLMEAYETAPEDEIVQTYVRALTYTSLPLSEWWGETNIRRRALEQYYESLSDQPDLQYRIAAVHFPERLAELVPDEPTTAAEWWVHGRYALDVEQDMITAFDAFDRAITLNRTAGDYYVTRAQATAMLDTPPPERDLKLAQLLRTRYESVNYVRASFARGAERERLLALAVPPRFIEQNFEGVLFGGRTASFELLPEMRDPGPGTPIMQPWHDLAAIYEADGRIDQARGVYTAILDYAPGERLARERLAHSEG